MPQKGVSKKIDRLCLICCGKTRAAHLGIDICRACSVFYRRAEKGNSYTCRSSSKQCPLGSDLNCKRCRFDHIDKLLNLSGRPSELAASSNEPCPEASVTPPENSMQPCAPSTFTTNSKQTELPILERLRVHYRTMSMVRLNSELHGRENPPHPLEINLETGPFYPVSFGSLKMSNRILLTTLLDFGSCTFPEYGILPVKEKWDIAVNLFYRFRIFEGCYRAGIVFPGDMDKMFGGFTTWWDVKNLGTIYNDAPYGDKASAREHMRHSSARLQDVTKARELLRRINPSHEEFLVVIALMFWSFGDMPVRDEIVQLGERYRESILKELHIFYREQMGLDDYAARLGELMMLLPTFDRTYDVKEHFEMLRLLDILPEDDFLYQLQR